MKSFILIITFLTTITSLAQTGTLDKRKSLFCHARNGLSLRTTARLNGEKDTLISYGDEIKLIQKSDSTFSVNGLLGSWYKVDYQGHEGFVFSAFVSPIQIKVKKGKHVYLKDYAYENLRQTDGDPNFEMEDYLEKPKSAIFGNERYQCTEGGYCDLDERLYLEGSNVQELFVVLCAYLMDYNEYTFKRSKFDFDEESKTYRYTYYKERKDFDFAKEIFISYTLNEEGSYQSMSSGFDWEGGGGTFNVYKWSDGIICAEHTYYCH